MHKYIIYNCIELSISDEDWDYLCQNRWFTTKPELEDIKAEFISGTGISPSKEHLWDKASILFHEYVTDLKDIQKMDINIECRNMLSFDEKYKEGIIN